MGWYGKGCFATNLGDSLLQKIRVEMVSKETNLVKELTRVEMIRRNEIQQRRTEAPPSYTRTRHNIVDRMYD